MTFRIPLSSFVDQTARNQAAAAQSTANAAQSAAASAQTAAAQAITLADNPLAQIPDGTLPGSKLAADAIDGRTITGATLRTAAAGQRVQIDSVNGLVGFNPAGQAVTQLRPSDGTLVASGAQITGRLDTGATGGPRVSVYQYDDGTYRRGRVEFADGHNSPAAFVEIAAGGISGGTDFAVSGEGAGGVTPPSLHLNVESAGGGGYNPIARLSGAPLLIDTAGTRLQGKAPIVGAAGGFSGTGNASAQVTVTHGLGVTPAAFLITPANNSVIPTLLDYFVISLTATTAVVEAIRRDNNTAFAGNPLAFFWAALLPTP